MEIKELYELLSKQIKGLEDRFDGLENRFDGLEKKYDDKFDKIERRLDSIEHSIIGIENDHGNKLSALFDHFVANQDKHNEYEENFVVINKRLDDYSFRLADVEDSVKKLLSQNK